MKNEALKKMNTEVREAIEKALGSSGIQDTIAATRAATAEDSGTFEVIISTDAVDRQGESIKQDGWDLSFYKMNPVVLWAHDYYSMPIGVCDSIGVENGKLVAKGRFAPAEANPFAQQVRALYDAGMMRTTSVGFIAKEVDGETITKAELLEFSFVPVPANPMALSLRQMKELGIDREALSFKGISIKEKAEGDTCTLADGTEGIIDAEGVCVAIEGPDTAKADPMPGDTCTLEDGTEGVIDEGGTCVVKPTEAKADPKPGDVCLLDDGTDGVIDDAGKCVPMPQNTDDEMKSKGAVQDELDAEEAYEAKWDQLDPICEALNAFFDVYLDEETTPDQFATLVNELATILQGIANGNTGEPAEGPDGSTTEASLNTGTIKSLLGKAKSVISRIRVEKAMGMEIATNAGNSKTGASRGTGQEEADGGLPAKQRSNDVGSDALTALKKYNEERAVLREIATIVGDALGKINAKGKTR